MKEKVTERNWKKEIRQLAYIYYFKSLSRITVHLNDTWMLVE